MSVPRVQILGPNGRPLASAAAFEGGDRFSRELLSWSPALRSADADLLPEKDTLVARTRDLVRNYGLASGAVQLHLDNIIGSGLRLSAKPDWRILGQSAEWAAEWSRITEAKFRAWSYDVDRFCDAGRRLNLAGMLGQGYRSYMMSGEILASGEWLPNRGGQYATAIQMINPDRLSNPGGASDQDRQRAGVELDSFGAPVAYHIRNRHPRDIAWGSGESHIWRRVSRATPWGRTQIIHIYDQELAGQTRGKSGFASVLLKSKMLDKFERTTLEASIVNAMYAAVIESDLASATEAIGSTDLSGYMDQAAAFKDAGGVKFDGVKVPHLFPGESLKLLSPEHPSSSFASFEEAALRHLAGGLNLSYEQLSRDYSKTNYAGARAGLLESWRFFKGRREAIGGELATQVYALWLEEAMDKGEIDQPPGAPDFYDAKTAWTRCRWIGPGRGHIDPLKEGKADALENDRGWLTMEDACANRGTDWEENLEQIAREKARMKELGVTPAELAAVLAAPEQSVA